MMYKNSVKLLFSNFSLVWKKLLFNLILGLIIGGLCYLSAVPVFKVLKANDLFDMVHNLFADFITNLNLVKFFEDVGAIGTAFADIISNNFKTIGFNIVLFLFLLFILGKFLNGYSLLSQAEVLYSSMSSNMKVGMLASIFNCFSKITLFELTKFIITFPIDLFIAYVIILCFRLFGVSGFIGIFAPFIIMLVAIILISLRISMFCCWMPHIAVKDMGIFNSLKINFKLVLRRLPKIFSNSLGIVFTIIVVNGFAILFTFGVGLLITIPVSSVLINTFQMSAFYGCYGMRYYVDYATIVEPKRMEATERLSKTKYHI